MTTTKVQPPTRSTCSACSRSVSAAASHMPTSRAATRKVQATVEDEIAKERRPCHKAAEAVNMLLDQVNMSDSFDMDGWTVDDDSNPVYTGLVGSEHEDKYEMSVEEFDIEAGLDDDNQNG